MTTLDAPDEDKDKLPDVRDALSFEGQFDLIAFENQADKLSHKDAIRMLKTLNRQRILREHVFKSMMRRDIMA